MLALILVELTMAQKRDGESLRRLRGVFAAIIFNLLFPTIATIENYTDVSPGFDLRPLLEQWVWVAYATLATMLVRFWFALHRWIRNKNLDSPR
jgi:hypothetical protein